jgi:undecaprenyl-diphosphatase
MELHILEIIKAVILGLVEGVTEFLPISSTGHLIIVNQFISFDKDFTVLFDIIIQLGAILAVLVYFIKKLWPFTKDKIKNKETLNIWYKAIVGIIPAMLLGVIFASFIEEKLFNPWVVAISLLVGGLVVLFIENKKKTAKIISIEDLSFKNAFFIGLIQCLSMIPGVSRSASTIIGGMFLGASRVVATEFSFFLAIPTMFAASAYSLLKYKGVISPSQFSILIIGFAVSFVVALAIVKFFINFVQKNNFKIFGYYRIILGLIIILYFAVK